MPRSFPRTKKLFRARSEAQKFGFFGDGWVGKLKKKFHNFFLIYCLWLGPGTKASQAESQEASAKGWVMVGVLRRKKIFISLINLRRDANQQKKFTKYSRGEEEAKRQTGFFFIKFHFLMKMKTKVLLFLFHTSRLLINTNTSLATGAVLTAVETRKKLFVRADRSDAMRPCGTCMSGLRGARPRKTIRQIEFRFSS